MFLWIQSLYDTKVFIESHITENWNVGIVLLHNIAFLGWTCIIQEYLPIIDTILARDYMSSYITVAFSFAITGGRLDIIKYIDKNYTKYINHINIELTFSDSNNDYDKRIIKVLDYLKEAHSIVFKYTESAIENAMKVNNISILEWYRKNNIYDRDALRSYVKNTDNIYADVLIWSIGHKLLDDSILDIYYSKEHISLEVIVKDRENSITGLSQNKILPIIISAIKGGRVDIMKWMREKGYVDDFTNDDKNKIKAALIDNPHYDLLKEAALFNLSRTPIQFIDKVGEKTCIHAAENGKFVLLKEAVYAGYKIGILTCEAAIKCSHFGVFRWAVDTIRKKDGVIIDEMLHNLENETKNPFIRKMITLKQTRRSSVRT
jgi:hypothetical protein